MSLNYSAEPCRLASNLLLRFSPFKNVNLSQTRYGSFDEKSNKFTRLLQKKIQAKYTILTAVVRLVSLDIVHGQLPAKAFRKKSLRSDFYESITSSPIQEMVKLTSPYNALPVAMDAIYWLLNDSLRRMSHETKR